MRGFIKQWLTGMLVIGIAAVAICLFAGLTWLMGHQPRTLFFILIGPAVILGPWWIGKHIE